VEGIFKSVDIAKDVLEHNGNHHVLAGENRSGGSDWRWRLMVWGMAALYNWRRKAYAAKLQSGQL
jgi:hypothetical protein